MSLHVCPSLILIRFDRELASINLEPLDLMKMSSVIFEKLTKNICSILINRPYKRNAINLDAVNNLKSAFTRFEEDKDLQIAILSGTGGNFCSGYDLNEFVNSREDLRPNLERINQLLWPIDVKLSRDKIMIAAIEGHAAGFGYELALKCDFRIADNDSRMGFMNRRLGIPIMNGGSVLLPKLIGYSRAKELIATGKAQLAMEALTYGCLTYVSSIGCSMGRALNLARCLAKFDQNSLRHDLSLLSLENNKTEQLLRAERDRSLKYLEECSKLDAVGSFLSGQLYRHGNYDMGNMLPPEPEVTL